MAVTSAALADLSFGLRHTAARFRGFAEDDRAGNADLFLTLARERAEDADVIDRAAVQRGLAQGQTTLDATSANNLLGLGNSEPWSARSTAYRVQRAQNALGRMTAQLASLTIDVTIAAVLDKVLTSIDERREQVREARRRAQRAVGGAYDYDMVARDARPLSVKGKDVTVWFGTNRRQGGRGQFLPERSTSIIYGRCAVFVPEDRPLGSLGRTLIGRLVHGDDRVAIRSVETLDEAHFWAALTCETATASPGEKQALVFLHGYKTPFEEAARRTAQLKADLGHAGPAAFFAWPSLGSLANYAGDEAAIEGSELAIRSFLTDFATRSGASAVHIIAHSMGNRGLLRAFDAIAKVAAASSPVRFGQVFLAAPDVDTDLFQHLSAAYGRLSKRTTLYVTNNDKAIGLSRRLHRWPRAGLTPPVAIVSGVDTVDASHVNLGLLGHSYAAEMRPVLGDIHRLLQGDAPPDKRFGLRKADGPGAGHWVFAR